MTRESCSLLIFFFYVESLFFVFFFQSKLGIRDTFFNWGEQRSSRSHRSRAFESLHKARVTLFPPSRTTFICRAKSNNIHLLNKLKKKKKKRATCTTTGTPTHKHHKKPRRHAHISVSTAAAIVFHGSPVTMALTVGTTSVGILSPSISILYFLDA